MTFEPITTEAKYREVLKEIGGLVMAAPNTADAKRRENLVVLVEAYERTHTLESLLKATPVDALVLTQEDRDWLHNTLPSESGDDSWDSFFQAPGVTPDYLQDREQPNDEEP